MLLVMGFLSRNILRDRSNVRFADAEYAISGLPGELNVSFFVYPSRRVCFDYACDLRRRVIRANPRQHVNVIGGAIDDEGRSAQFTNYDAEIGGKLGLNFGCAQWLEALRAGDYVRDRISIVLGRDFV